MTYLLCPISYADPPHQPLPAPPPHQPLFAPPASTATWVPSTVQSHDIPASYHRHNVEVRVVCAFLPDQQAKMGTFDGGAGVARL
jgi:hypothetical protein